MLPTKYKWLDTIGTLPKLVSAGLQYLGVKEIKGSANNPVIMEMARGLGVDDIYTSDDTQSWCALFINHLIRITGKPPVPTQGDKYNLLRAKWLANWGKPVARGEEVLGDLIILSREGGGHCCLYIAETEKGFLGLGGNQANSVIFSEFDSHRIVAVRNYYATIAPPSAKRYKVNSDGNFSVNEA